MKFIKLGLVAAALMTISGRKSRPAEGHQDRRSARKPVCNRLARRRCHEPVWPVLANRFLER